VGQFKKLQILGITVHSSQFGQVIPYLGSKFTRDHFKRMQINIFAEFDREEALFYDYLKIGKYNLKRNNIDILPKHI
jgi:hypothetical protein